MKSFSSSILLECACLYGLRKSARALYELPKTVYLDLAVTWEESTTRTAQPMARHAPQFTPNPHWKLIVTLSGPAISVASLQIGFSGFGFATPLLCCEPSGRLLNRSVSAQMPCQSRVRHRQDTAELLRRPYSIASGQWRSTTHQSMAHQYDSSV